ncbi:MAG: hypothetical protein AB2L12_10925 [Smithellaceae bacterium]
MSSKSKDVRIEQRRILEKKLDLRLQQLAQKGISKEKAQSDPLVKNLKAKIRETNIRIKTADKFLQRTQELAQAKTQKLADLAKKEEAPEPGLTPETSEPKQKKKPAAVEKEPKPKKKTADSDAEPKKQPRKKKEEAIKE